MKISFAKALCSLRNFQQSLSIRNYDFFIAILFLCLGVSFRLVQYNFNRSLWVDEAMLARNLIDRSFPQLLLPLSHNQAAPLGFLLSVKLLMKLWGASEQVLRFLPLLTGILFLPLFYYVVRKLIGHIYALIALLLVSFSPTLIYFSNELKPYHVDVFLCLLMLSLAFLFFEKKGDAKIGAVLGCTGAFVIWFSYPVVFILAGIGITWLIYTLRNRSARNVAVITFAGGLWLISFAAFYFISLRFVSNNEYLTNYWAGNYPPFPITSGSDIKWYLDSYIKLFDVIAEDQAKGLVLFLFIVGAISYYKEDRIIFSILLWPFPILYFVSALEKYVLYQRFLLFLVPLLLLLVLKGIQFIQKALPMQVWLIPVLVAGIIGYSPTYTSVNNFIHPNGREEVRPIAEFSRQNWQEGDVIYVYYLSADAYYYYARKLEIPADEIVYGSLPQPDLEGIRKELTQFDGQKRVWFIFSHMRQDYYPAFMEIINTMGTQVMAQWDTDAVVYLYDLSD